MGLRGAVWPEVEASRQAAGAHDQRAVVGRAIQPPDRRDEPFAPYQLASVRRPRADLLVLADRVDFASVRRRPHTHRPATVAGSAELLGSTLYVPDDDLVVAADAGETLIIEEVEIERAALVPGQHAKWRAVGQAPEPDRAVVAPAGKHIAVGRDRQGIEAGGLLPDQR